jgi:endonuclease/exonuclease/phosphatase family metal-dependent hydrolase
VRHRPLPIARPLAESIASAVLALAFLLALVTTSPIRALANEGPTVAICDTDLVVMTFNIRYSTARDGVNNWVNRREMVFDILRRYDPDVVGLQEALRHQIDEIRATLPQYEEIGCGRDGQTQGEYSAILYRKDRLDVDDCGTFWLSDTPELPRSITWGNACTRICTWGRFLRKDRDGAFYLFNTHLDHISRYSRDRSVILLARQMRDRAHPDPVIVTGDLNASEHHSAVRYLKGEVRLGACRIGPSKNPVPLVDTFRVLHPDARRVGTFNGFRGRTSGRKIDYVFAQPDFEVRSAEILRDHTDGRYPSDHFPVIAVLGLPIRTGHVASHDAEESCQGG